MASVNEVVKELKIECKRIGLREFCRINDLDPGHVSKIINKHKPLSSKVSLSVGYLPTTVYIKV